MSIQPSVESAARFALCLTLSIVLTWPTADFWGVTSLALFWGGVAFVCLWPVNRWVRSWRGYLVQTTEWMCLAGLCQIGASQLEAHLPFNHLGLRTLLVNLGALMLALLLAALLQRRVLRLRNRLPYVVCVSGLLSVVCHLLVRFWPDLALTPLLSLSTVFAVWLAMIHLWFPDRSAVVRSTWRDLVSLVFLVAVLVNLVWLAAPSGAYLRSQVSRVPLGQATVALLRRPFDRDGDGFATLFGLRDCDDTNPDRNEWSGCVARSPQPATSRWGTAPRRNVLLITFDALRQDAVAPYCQNCNTPTFRSLSEASVVFTRARTTATNTIFALSSIFFGVMPGDVGIEPMGRWPRVTTHRQHLAEHFRRAGYFTGALVETDFLSNQPALLAPFEVHLSVSGGVKPNAASRLARRQEFLARIPTDRPRFIWIHVLDAHAPYDGPGLPREAYRHGVEYGADQTLAQLLAIEELTRDALVVVSADHGETLNDRGGAGHGATLHIEEVAIPLFVRWPNGHAQIDDTRFVTLDILGELLVNASQHASQPAALAWVPRQDHAAAMMYRTAPDAQTQAGRLETPAGTLLYYPLDGIAAIYTPRDLTESEPLWVGRGDPGVQRLLSIRAQQTRW